MQEVVVSGANQPLVVVDGVPLDNFTGTGNNDFGNPGTDMGNGLADINSGMEKQAGVTK